MWDFFMNGCQGDFGNGMAFLVWKEVYWLKLFHVASFCMETDFLSISWLLSVNGKGLFFVVYCFLSHYVLKIHINLIYLKEEKQMKKMTKKLLSLMLVLAMVLSMTACGTKAEAPAEAPAAEAPAAEAPAEAPAEEPA